MSILDVVNAIIPNEYNLQMSHASTGRDIGHQRDAKSPTKEVKSRSTPGSPPLVHKSQPLTKPSEELDLEF
jgi:hypothetical protein